MANAQEVTMWLAVTVACLVSGTFLVLIWRLMRRTSPEYVPTPMERRMIRYLHREMVIKPAFGQEVSAVTLRMMFHAANGTVVDERQKTFSHDAPESNSPMVSIKQGA